MDNTGSRSTLRLIAVLISAVILAWCVYLIVSAVITSKTTGILVVKSVQPKASISISQPGHGAQFIGVDNATVRLKPGVYNLATYVNGKETVTTANIKKGQTTNATLDVERSFTIPSVDDVEFQNFNFILNSGISSEQMSGLKLDFFRYKPSAKVIAVDSGSIAQQPHNPDSTDPFRLDFRVSVDGKILKAEASYAGITDISLKLTDQGSGKVVLSTN